MTKYVKIIEKNVILFGSLFNDINITRKSKDGTLTKDIKVPILYASKERFMYLLDNKLVNENQPKVQNVYPRMSFALRDIKYDNNRKGISNLLISGTNNDVTEVQLNRVPYNFTFELNLASTHQTDLFQMIEQILVLFKPSLNITAILNPDVNDNEVDVAVVLLNNTFEDFKNEVPYENIDDKPIMHTITFDMKSWLYCTAEDDNISKVPINTVELGFWPFDTVIDDVTEDIWYPKIIN